MEEKEDWDRQNGIRKVFPGRTHQRVRGGELYLEDRNWNNMVEVRCSQKELSKIISESLNTQTLEVFQQGSEMK